MKKHYLLICSFCLLFNFLKAQKLIIVNGGQFGNPQENVNVQIYDPNSKTSHTIDTIHTNSVQDILMDGNFAFVAAQDSIVKYDLSTEQRIASAGFNGVSTKSLAVYQNYLLVGNWYGKSSHNLYVYDRTSLALLDSVQQVTKGVASMLVMGPTAFISQNSSTANFEDTLGYITAVNLDSIQQVAHLILSNYTSDIGQLIETDNSLLALNPVSNTVLEFQNLPSTTPNIHQFQQDIQVQNPYQYSLYEDTLYLKWDNKIGAVDISSFNIIDTTVLDTVVTAFALDTVRKQFYITQTDFFSYRQGGVYNYAGQKLDTLAVGYSPEIAAIYSPLITSIKEIKTVDTDFLLYPNPATDLVYVDLTNNEPVNIKIIDLQGRILSERLIKPYNKVQMDVSGVKPGVYMVQVQTAEGFHSKKLMIQ